jgi:hypothetical protein
MDKLTALTIVILLFAVYMIWFGEEVKAKYPFLFNLSSSLVGGVLIANFIIRMKPI